MVQSVVQLGGNMPGTLEKIRAFPAWITEKGFEVTEASPIYGTSPWGMEGVPDFLNQVLLIQTSTTPEVFFQTLLQYEAHCGRTRHQESGYVSRIMDVDLLLFGETILALPELVIPHPRMHLRNFILLPLAALSPKLIHPVLKKSMQELLLACPDKGEVYIFEHG